MKKFKIVYLITDLSTGGTPITLSRLLSGLDRSRFQPSVVGFFSKESYVTNEIAKLNIPVYNLGISHKVRLDKILRINSYLRNIQPEILHTWLFHANITGRIFGRLNRVPIIITSRRSIDIGGVWREKLMRMTSMALARFMVQGYL